MKELAAVALNAAKSKGASYADIRFVRVLRKFVSTREDHVTGITDTESYGYGIRALVEGCAARGHRVAVGPALYSDAMGREPLRSANAKEKSPRRSRTIDEHSKTQALMRW